MNKDVKMLKCIQTYILCASLDMAIVYTNNSFHLFIVLCFAISRLP